MLSPLFKGVPSRALRDVASVMIEQQFTAGELLLEQDLDGDTLHLLTHGSVRVLRTGATGRERIMGDLYAPHIVGETAVLHSGQRSASVVALEPVCSLMLHRQHFEQLLQRQPQVLWNLATLLCQRITCLNDELIALGHTTESAIIHVLCCAYQQRREANCAVPQVLPLTTTDLMNRVSASRETVTRVMRRLESSALIKVRSRQIELLAPDELEGLLHNLD